MNWAFASSAKRPPLATSSSKVPVSMMRPWSKTRMRSALRIVASRCAMTKVVRPFMTSSSASWSLRSVAASSALVRLDHLLVGGLRPPDLEVLADRAREQHRLLEHDADVAAERGEADVADVVAVD